MWVFVDTLEAEGGNFAVEPQGETRTLRSTAFPVGVPTSIGFLRVQAFGHFPATYDGLWLTSIDTDPQSDGTYVVTANYKPRPPRDQQFSTFRLTSSSDTVNVKTSLETVAKYGPGGGEPEPIDDDPGAGVLGWDGENVQGIEVPAPGLTWVETHVLPQHLVTRGYLGRLTLLRGHVNSTKWKGFEAGEAKFEGLEASAEVQDADSEEYTWTLVFSFAARPNETGIKIGKDITVPAKDGWDHLEIRYRKEAKNGQVLGVPTAAYVERVFPRIDFAELGIGE